MSGYSVVGYPSQLSLVGNRLGGNSNARLRAAQSLAYQAQAQGNRRGYVQRPSYEADEAEAIMAVQRACPPGPYATDVLVEDTPYRKSGRRPLGFPATVVTAGASSGAIVSQPQKPFKANRLVIPSSVGGLFIITSLQIGNDEMLMNGNPVPALTFNENAEDCWLNLETAQISQNISITVTNISGATATFYGAMLGVMVRS